MLLVTVATAVAAPSRQALRDLFTARTGRTQVQLVVAVGHGKKTDKGEVIPLDVKAGERILFGKYSGTEIKIDDQEYLILREDEVLGVLEAAKHAAGGKK